MVCVLVLAFADLMLQGGLLLLGNPTRERCHARMALQGPEKLGILGWKLALRIAEEIPEHLDVIERGRIIAATPCRKPANCVADGGIDRVALRQGGQKVHVLAEHVSLL